MGWVIAMITIFEWNKNGDENKGLNSSKNVAGMKIGFIKA
jgi:hypothetical protein